MDVLDRIRQIADTVRQWPPEKLAMTVQHLTQDRDDFVCNRQYTNPVVSHEDTNVRHKEE